MSKRKYLINFIFFIPLIISAQLNVVPNASFEELSSCPNDRSLLNLAKGWFSPNLGTPDLFNSCADKLTGVSVPQTNFSIYRLPHSGNGYAGVFTYQTPGFNEEIREYTAIRLINPLKKGKSFYFLFYTVTHYKTTGSSQCFSDAIGMSASKEEIKETVPFKRLQLKPIAFNKGKILMDTIKWTKISNVHSGNQEQYIYIGSFEPNATTLNTKESCEAGFFGASYYFIDDVGVYEYDPLPDTLLLCNGQSKRVGGRFLDGTYRWNTGATDSTIIVGKSGRYIMTVRMDDKYEMSDTMYVINPAEAVALLPRDTSFCKGENLTWAFPNLGNYQWSNGSKNNVFETKSAGFYQTTITNSCGIFKHEIEVKTEDCNCNIFIPTAFSPHTIDGVNDELKCFVKCGLRFKVLRFQIFDRWGNQLYLLSDALPTAIAWDGIFRGELLPQGVYTYTFEYEYLKKGKIIRENKLGDFILMQ